MRANDTPETPDAKAEPTYLGDGLYATYDGFQFWLIANDPGSDQRVALEPHVFRQFLDFAAAKLGARITFDFPPQAPDATGGES